MEKSVEISIPNTTCPEKKERSSLKEFVEKAIHLVRQQLQFLSSIYLLSDEDLSHLGENVIPVSYENLSMENIRTVDNEFMAEFKNQIEQILEKEPNIPLYHLAAKLGFSLINCSLNSTIEVPTHYGEFVLLPNYPINEIIEAKRNNQKINTTLCVEKTEDIDKIVPFSHNLIRYFMKGSDDQFVTSNNGGSIFFLERIRGEKAK